MTEDKKKETVILLDVPATDYDEEATYYLGLSQVAHALHDEPLRDIVESYVRYYAKGDAHTARAKRYDLEHFLEFLDSSKKGSGPLQVSDWTLDSTQAFLDYRLELGEAAATVARRLATLKHFGRTLAERVPGFINPAREARGPRSPLSRPYSLGAEEIEALRQVAAASAAEKPSFNKLRDRFLLELLLATGLRADEVRLLTINQISPDLCWLKNVRTKGRKFRNVYIDSQIRKPLAEYLAEREKEMELHFPVLRALSADERLCFPLFVGFYGVDLAKPASFGLSPKTIWRIIAAFGKKAQRFALDPLGKLHPHRLRHTFAHGLLDSSKDIRLVAQALGHSDVRTTMRYTERGEEEIQEAIEEKIRREQDK